VSSTHALREHYQQVLARRMPTLPEAVQRALAQRLHQAQAMPSRPLAATPARPPAAAVAPPVRAALAGLSRLTQELHHRARSGGEAPLLGEVLAPAQQGAPLGLASVRRMGAVWARMATGQRVAQALEQGPENAGPLNSHRLMLRTLVLMQQLSPDYLHRFLSQADTLLWLELHPPQRSAPVVAAGSETVKNKSRKRRG
jgi:hypothetical protein